jgi:hypothetical protein
VDLVESIAVSPLFVDSCGEGVELSVLLEHVLCELERRVQEAIEIVLTLFRCVLPPGRHGDIMA